MSKKDKGRHVWVRDPKVAEEEVFLKATFVAENIVSDKETQVCGARPIGTPAPSLTCHFIAAQVTVKYEDGSTHIVNKNLILDVSHATNTPAARTHAACYGTPGGHATSRERENLHACLVVRRPSPAELRRTAMAHVSTSACSTAHPPRP
jgi:hypothetical protein